MPTVKHKLDPANPARMTPAEKARFDALSDADIDYSDAPELDAAFWDAAEVAKPNPKTGISLRVDAETLAFFKSRHPKGYSSRMAAVLKAYVQAQRG